MEKSYTVLGLCDATVSWQGNASSPRAAQEKAGRVLHFSLCHQCSDEVNVGDIYDTIVIDDETGEEVVESEQSTNRKRIAELTAQLAARDTRIIELEARVADLERVSQK